MSKQQLNLLKIKKIGSKWLILGLLFSILFLGLGLPSHVFAQSKKPFTESNLDAYPGVKERIEALRQAHPNWNFTIFYTDLDWNTVLENETTRHHGRSLVPNTKTGEWLCPICQDPWDTGKWYCASDIAVAYYMDPRNFLNEDKVFMFEDLSYSEGGQTIEGVQRIIAKAPYLDAQMIMNAAKEVKISPYHLASRIVQEQGNRQEPGVMISGTYPGYEGYYNYLNVNASGNGEADVIQNGLQYAKDHGWDTPEKSIVGGANFIAEKWIAVGQSSLYLQKFDVVEQGGLYSHQYQQNIQAPESECSSIKKSYLELGGFDNNSGMKLNFVIPVYRNMPAEPARYPQSDGQATVDDIVTQDVEVTGNSVAVRKERSTDAEVLGTLNAGDKILRIQKGNKEVNGYIWDKVVLADGRKGFIAGNYVKQVGVISNCNEQVRLTGSSVRLRNGPGTDGTTSVKSLAKGTIVTRIEKGKYDNLNGYNWHRIRLSDGTMGYVASNYLEIAEAYNAEKVNIEGNYFIAEPKVTVEIIKKTYSNAVIKNAKGEVVNSGNVGTNYTVTIDGKTYPVAKLGDVNGDGEITPADATVLLRGYLDLIQMTVAERIAADVSRDDFMIPADATMILRAYLELENISI